eukprot:TRINITY_DN2422_c0_g1_i1.p1 TRINITY_DN2422_c0_g1~~TRINITY_DN2422_c0_g1_i1.p1  ORF type:complete len:1572 (-),score=548.15 TRINITY_DN2422_c0_g1_i1:385-5100(-)
MTSSASDKSPRIVEAGASSDGRLTPRRSGSTGQPLRKTRSASSPGTEAKPVLADDDDSQIIDVGHHDPRIAALSRSLTASRERGRDFESKYRSLLQQLKATEEEAERHKVAAREHENASKSKTLEFTDAQQTLQSYKEDLKLAMSQFEASKEAEKLALRNGAVLQLELGLKVQEIQRLQEEAATQQASIETLLSSNAAMARLQQHASLSPLLSHKSVPIVVTPSGTAAIDPTPPPAVPAVDPEDPRALLGAIAREREAWLADRKRLETQLAKATSDSAATDRSLRRSESGGLGAAVGLFRRDSSMSPARSLAGSTNDLLADGAQRFDLMPDDALRLRAVNRSPQLMSPRRLQMDGPHPEVPASPVALKEPAVDPRTPAPTPWQSMEFASEELNVLRAEIENMSALNQELQLRCDTLEQERTESQKKVGFLTEKLERTIQLKIRERLHLAQQLDVLRDQLKTFQERYERFEPTFEPIPPPPAPIKDLANSPSISPANSRRGSIYHQDASPSVTRSNGHGDTPPRVQLDPTQALEKKLQALHFHGPPEVDHKLAPLNGRFAKIASVPDHADSSDDPRPSSAGVQLEPLPWFEVPSHLLHSQPSPRLTAASSGETHLPAISSGSPRPGGAAAAVLFEDDDAGAPTHALFDSSINDTPDVPALQPSHTSGHRRRPSDDFDKGTGRSFDSVFQDLLSSETAYIADLETIHEVFEVPLKTCYPPIIPLQEVMSIFTDMAEILSTQRSLLADLRALPVPRTGVAGVFSKYLEQFRVYARYCANQIQQQCVLDQQQRKSRALAQFLLAGKRNPRCRQLSLDYLLALPTTRVCKYPTYIKKLSDFYTDTEEPLKQASSETHSKLADFIASFSEKRKAFENFFKIVEISGNLEGLPGNVELVTPTRRFIRGGTLGKISKGKLQDRHFFLFSDLLIYCKYIPAAPKPSAAKKQYQWHYRGKIEPGVALVQDIFDKHNDTRFCLIRHDKNRTASILCTKTSQDKKMWLADLNEYICKRTVSSAGGLVPLSSSSHSPLGSSKDASGGADAASVDAGFLPPELAAELSDDEDAARHSSSTDSHVSIVRMHSIPVFRARSNLGTPPQTHSPHLPIKQKHSLARDGNEKLPYLATSDSGRKLEMRPAASSELSRSEPTKPHLHETVEPVRPRASPSAPVAVSQDHAPDAAVDHGRRNLLPELHNATIPVPVQTETLYQRLEKAHKAMTMWLTDVVRRISTSRSGPANILQETEFRSACQSLEVNASKIAAIAAEGQQPVLGQQLQQQLPHLLWTAMQVFQGGAGPEVFTQMRIPFDTLVSEIQGGIRELFFSIKSVGIAHDQNAAWRPTMEDEVVFVDRYGDVEHQGYFGLYDGHGGRATVEFVAQKLHAVLLQELQRADRNVAQAMRQAYSRVDEMIVEKPILVSGCTSVSAVIRKNENGERWLYVSNVGDSRAVLCRNGVAERLSYDHKPSDKSESERVKNSPTGYGFIMNGRIGGVLAVARAFGDIDLKEYGLLAEPYISETLLRPTDTHLIIACDGLWDVASDQDAVDCLRDETSAQRMSEKLLRYALEHRSKDNVSVMVIIL